MTTQAEQDAVQRCQLYISPFAHLPREVIGLILKQLIDTSTAKELPNPFIVLQISSGLRHLALGLGFLFKDTARFVQQADLRVHIASCLSERERECLVFCVENSRGLVTSLVLDRLCNPRLLWTLEVAEASKAILERLDLPSQGPDRACDACLREGDPDPPYARVQFPPETCQSRMLRIVSGAAQLQRLDLDISKSAPKYVDLPDSSSSQARPFSLRLTVDASVGQMQTRPKLDNFLKVLMSRVDDFTLNVGRGHESSQERTPAWTLATRNSQSLRHLGLEVHYTWDLTAYKPVDFPILDKLIMLGEYKCRGGSPVRLNAPQLKTLAAKAISVDVINASALTLVHLDLDKLSSGWLLAPWLMTLPELERLELRFVSGMKRDYQRDVTPDFEDPTAPSGHEDDPSLANEVLSFLIPTQTGTAICPKLHTLGIESSYEGNPDLGWTSGRDWSAWVTRETYGNKFPVDDMLKIDAHAISQIESQRRRLSQGLDPKDSNQSANLTPKEVKAKWGECCALQHIFLRGCSVDQKPWAALTAADSQVEAICIPDPLTKKEKKFGR